eukprot:8830713-Heterocapsa_arctica.AAC.1
MTIQTATTRRSTRSSVCVDVRGTSRVLPLPGLGNELGHTTLCCAAARAAGPSGDAGRRVPHESAA